MREWTQAWVVPCAVAYGMDLVCGHPDWLPHPVKAVGALVERLEGTLYSLRWRRAAGVVLLLATVSVTLAVIALLLALAAACGRWVHFAAVVILLWMAFATRSLVAHGEAVRTALVEGDLPRARCKLARMVSRDTSGLDGSGVARACIESLAENLTDGCLFSLLFGLLGGPLAAWGLKAVSTLDSMVGYRNARYSEFGWASARCDDAAHYLPARLLWLVLPPASWCCGASGARCLRAMMRDGDKTASPNSGLPEAGVAGALGVELGGASVYAGVRVDKERLNADGRAPAAGDIRRTQKLVLVASALPLLAALTLVLT